MSALRGWGGYLQSPPCFRFHQIFTYKKDICRHRDFASRPWILRPHPLIKPKRVVGYFSFEAGCKSFASNHCCCLTVDCLSRRMPQQPIPHLLSLSLFSPLSLLPLFPSIAPPLPPSLFLSAPGCPRSLSCLACRWSYLFGPPGATMSALIATLLIDVSQGKKPARPPLLSPFIQGDHRGDDKQVAEEELAVPTFGLAVSLERLLYISRDNLRRDGGWTD